MQPGGRRQLLLALDPFADNSLASSVEFDEKLFELHEIHTRTLKGQKIIVSVSAFFFN